MTSVQQSHFSPLVSIVIPVYNGANYLKESIDSALNQSYPHIEVIVVNDGSRDEGATEAVALSYGERIRYFSKANGGCGSALNFGIKQMKGEYFSWLSHDDRYTGNKIQWQINKLSSLEDRHTILYGGYELIDPKSEIVGSIHPDQQYSEDQLNTPLFAVLKGLAYGCTFLIPKKSFFEIGFFDESLPTTQDYALWFEFFRAIPIHYDYGINTQYRLHPEQDTKNHPGHIKECDELWIGFLRKISSKEKIAISGSELKFSYDFYDFLSTTQYQAALQFAKDELGNTLSVITVSVIIPFYNNLPLAIESLCSAQTQTHDNIEIILVDDGSTDDLTRLFELIKADKRIHYFRQENQGPSIARNLGLKHASGKYVAFLDADDLFEPEKIKEQLAFMEAKSLSFSHTAYTKISMSGLPIESSGKEPESKLQNKIEWLYPQIIEMCTIATPTVMALKEVFTSSRFKEGLKSGEDICLWIEVARNYEIGYIVKPLTKVRVSAESHAYNLDKSVEGDLNIALHLIKDPYHSQNKKELAKLINNISLSLAKQSGNYPTSLIEISSTSDSQLSHNQAPPKSISLNDVEGFFVQKLKARIPSPIWRISTKVYRLFKPYRG